MSSPKTKPPTLRLTKLEAHQRDTNRRLGRVEDRLVTSSKMFELMHGQLERLERGHLRVVERLDLLNDAVGVVGIGVDQLAGTVDQVSGSVDQLNELNGSVDQLNGSVNRLAETVDLLAKTAGTTNERLDRLVDSSTRDRTAWAVRFKRLEDRLGAVERKLNVRPPSQR